MNTGQIASNFSEISRKPYHWMEQIDAHCFVSLSTHSDAVLFDVRDSRHVQRRYPNGPIAYKCAGSVSYDSQYLSFGSESGFSTYDLSDTRPLFTVQHQSPVYFTKYHSVNNFLLAIDLEKHIFVYQ